MRKLLALALGIALLTGCASAPIAPPDTLRIVTPYKVKSLDPIKQGLWSPEWGYGELLMRATDNGGVEPWVLQRLEPVNGTQWRLVLRSGVTFSNGRELDSAVLKTVLERHLAENALVKANLPGAKIETPDANTVLLSTSAPVVNLPNLLADEQSVTVFDPQAQGVYTGPFTVSKLDDNELVLARNPKYWGGQAKLSEVRVRFVPDGQARLLAVRTGEADIALYPPTDALGSVKDAASGPRMATASQPLQQLRAIPNLRRAPMNDLAVRRAFALAIDYDQLAKQVLDGLYRTPKGIYPDAVPYALETQRTDIAEARRLLDDAGWMHSSAGARVKDGKLLRLTVLTYPQQPDTKAVAVALQAQLSAVGIGVQVTEVQDNYEALKGDAWDVGLSFDGTLGYTYDPIGPLRDFLTSQGSKNFGGVADAELDNLVSDLRTTTDTNARTPLLHRIQRVITDRGYLTVVAQRSSAAVVGGAFTGYRPSSVLHHVTATTRAG
ncbi:ABC transporter substrate-binding protein [Allokutzneria albata]|uniref:Peptide/nickel transport system substrate-binding protein n=1 Tax=Allokutzneria albata TaxID=211114 RepID=A0A1G9R5T6_ALLAB|nr:ABC transporter substrate-binding protein [Allokutzneria albata]SDM18491.1 peptide/nickel transport system substrate-binding protein [Allokutzneria albata]